MKKLNFIFSLIALCFVLNCDSDSSNGDDPANCDAATEQVTEALADFNTANELNYTEKCNDYKSALENLQSACGDENGQIQALIDGLGDCTLTNNPGNIEALMTANIAGEQFNLMRPNGFNLFNNAIGMVTYSYFSDEDYIRIQGNSTYQNISPTEFTKEITIWIPQSSWSVGTYTLADSVVDAFETGETPTPHYGIVYFNNDEYPQAFEEEGTITITEFNLEDRVIRGTFEFSFMRSGDGVEIGPFQCMNGTFDYSLDDEYFD
ncbi:hypothetical protein [Psychroserpens algicola]|uniref:Lipoprotein n=1 Tax=Psychroserpens algicola TaxID=1719034 RepID=A0ABT0H6B7_9FLAO|nr:hypothetical protein [Psychroserpens algicola]MCK8479918.1 hypothetical protein [Psychroserpens algicola]